MKQDIDEQFYFECDCHSDEHMLKFSLWQSRFEDDEMPNLYTSIFLNQYRSFFKRFWTGLKYIFGYKCKYGHWDCWDIKPEDAERFREMIERFIEIRNDSKEWRNNDQKRTKKSSI